MTKQYRWASTKLDNIIPAAAFYFGGGVGAVIGLVARVPLAFCVGFGTMFKAEILRKDYNPLTDPETMCCDKSTDSKEDE